MSCSWRVLFQRFNFILLVQLVQVQSSYCQYKSIICTQVLLLTDYRIIFCWCQGVIVVVCCSQSSAEGWRRECSQAEEEGQGRGHVCGQVGAGGGEGDQCYRPAAALHDCQDHHLHSSCQVDPPSLTLSLSYFSLLLRTVFSLYV